jgi:geranylgeranylglycerol-phosphate geranylgeranyltransferase
MERPVRGFWTAVFGFVRIIRPFNGLLIFSAVVLSAYLASGRWDPILFVLGGFSISSISAAGYVVNDLKDRQLDAITKPTRPLVSGAVKPIEAIILTVILYLVGVSLSLPLGINAIITATAISGLTLVYSLLLKGKGLAGNILVSLLISSAFIYGWAFTGGTIINVLFPAVLAFLVNLGREILKDSEDLEGDEAFGYRTLPVVLGRKKSAIIAFLFFIAVCIITPIPYFLGMYDWIYLGLLVPVDFLLLYYGFRVIRSDDIVLTAFTHRLLKVLMLIALVGIWMGAEGIKLN